MRNKADTVKLALAKLRGGEPPVMDCKRCDRVWGFRKSVWVQYEGIADGWRRLGLCPVCHNHPFARTPETFWGTLD